MPQVHAPARTAEVDWGEAEVDLAGARTRCTCSTCARASPGRRSRWRRRSRPSRRSWRGTRWAFDWFGGVFAEVRYDNLGSAVKKVLRGRRRVETDRFVAMRSHYLFDSMFTTPGIEGRA